VYLSRNRALRGAAQLRSQTASFPIEPLVLKGENSVGLYARVGDPRQGTPFTLNFGLNCAASLSATAVGRNSNIQIMSTWPHPSFFGNFLPDSSKVSPEGFSAVWSIPHLARALPQISRDNTNSRARSEASMGVKFYQPTDFYKKAYRAARYGIIFIALTFLTVLLIERQGHRLTHPAQYLMIALAQAIFFLLMISYAEQVGFQTAYIGAASATIGLITAYGVLGMKMRCRAAVLGLSLVVLYSSLFMILHSDDYALLIGSLLAFVVLAAPMYVTRNEE
jgi:inner membrane protein